MISTLSKQGGRRYPQMGSTSGIFAGRLLSVGETEAPVPPPVVDDSGYIKRARLRPKSGKRPALLPGRDYIEQQEIAERTIRRVAERQAKAVREERLDDHQRFEELQRELELEDIEWQSEYLAMMNSIRNALITLEIKQRLEKKRLDAEDEEIMLLLLMAANV